MKAIVYNGIQDVKVKSVNDPSIEKSDDIIIKVTSTAIWLRPSSGPRLDTRYAQGFCAGA